MIPLLDVNTLTWDSDVVTMDAGMTSGQVILRDASMSSELVPLATARTATFQYDRDTFRSPYGTVWHQQGDARRLVENVTVQAYVVNDPTGISDAAITANALVSFAATAVELSTPIGEFKLVALLNVTRQPVESGYRLDFTFATLDGLRP